MLLLFDIDGTLLLSAAQAHAEALLSALRQVYGVSDAEPGGVATAGRTDLDIARTILVRAGVGAGRIDERLEQLRDACCAEYARTCPADLSARVAPGIAQLLEHLAALPNATHGLVTGNLEPIARLKLARAGLGRYFAQAPGGFGSDSEDRADLPAIARARAGIDGTPYPRDLTVVIGDTLRDIACARADGVRCIAVATGLFTATELRDADLVVEDAFELSEALGDILVAA